MRGILIALAVLLGALTGTPAAAQNAGPLPWLTGKWCAPSTQQGKVCLTFTPQPDGTIASEWASQSADAAVPEHSEAVISTVNGRLTMHSDDQNSDFREVSHGPDELVLESAQDGLSEGDLKLIRYRRMGDDLVLDFTFVGGKTATDRYRREN